MASTEGATEVGAAPWSLPDAMVIGGESIRSDRLIAVEDPSSGELIGEIPAGGQNEIDVAARAAAAAACSWAMRPVVERACLLRQIAAALREHAPELAWLESVDTGKPLSQARTDVQMAARYFDFYAGLAQSFGGYEVPLSANDLGVVQRIPYGVVGVIVPWNYPLQISSRSCAPALAAGNTVVLKPAEEASLTPLRLAEIAGEAGLPSGVLNVVTGYGEEAGAALVRHPLVRHIGFTGSHETGVHVLAAAAAQTKPVVLELGGKSPQIVFADADLDRAEAVVAAAILQNAGQTCSAGSRLLVEATIADDLIERLRRRFETVRIGRGVDDPDLGPLISQAQLGRVAAFVQDAIAEGIELVTGGARREEGELRRGYYFAPTLFRNVPETAPLFREEIFGPVLSATVFHDVEQALAAANATDYGLVAAIWTGDLSKAVWIANRLQAGQVFVNSYSAGGGIELPFGGVKQSGFGREKGVEAMHSYTQTRAIVLHAGSG